MISKWGSREARCGGVVLAVAVAVGPEGASPRIVIGEETASSWMRWPAVTPSRRERSRWSITDCVVVEGAIRGEAVPVARDRS
jgi:hypothetical protein